jgi:hypothetical protein
MPDCDLPVRDQTPLDALGCALAPLKRAFEGIGGATIGQWWDAVGWIVLLAGAVVGIGVALNLLGAIAASRSAASRKRRLATAVSAPELAQKPPNVVAWILLVFISGLFVLALIFSAFINATFFPALFVPFPLVILVAFGRLLWDRARATM